VEERCAEPSQWFEGVLYRSLQDAAGRPVGNLLPRGHGGWSSAEHSAERL